MSTEIENKAAKCPTCMSKVTNLSNEIREDIINTSSLVSSIIKTARRRALVRESCLLCVNKHIGAAKAFHREMLNAQGSGTESGEGSIDVKLNYIDVIGELQLAIDESIKWPELSQLITVNERAFRYTMQEPDWKGILLLVKALEDSSLTSDK